MSSNVTVCVRFRPLTSKEIAEHGDEVCIRCLDDKSFVFKDERGEELTFNFDKVFYSESEQASVYEFSVLPVVRDAVNAINGTIITYGQTGAGKTYTIEGPNIKESDELKKGLLQRVVAELFECMKSSDETVNYSMKLSMVEIYMEKVRDLLDLTKDNIQIKENKVQGIMLSGVTEEFKAHKRVRTGKLVIVDLAGSEKVEKTGAEGKVLEEAKTINKSLSALANVVNALTNPQGKTNHIPYRDSKLTRILQDALGGNSRAALLCCCSPSPCNAPESLSTLRFGARAKYIKAPPRCNFDEGYIQKNGFISPPKQDQCERVLNKLREKLEDEDVKLLEELFILEGILFDPDSIEELDEAYEDLTSRTISSLQKAVEELVITNDELKKENQVLRAGVATLEMLALEPGAIESIISAISRTLGVFRSMAFSFIRKLI